MLLGGRRGAHLKAERDTCKILKGKELPSPQKHVRLLHIACLIQNENQYKVFLSPSERKLFSEVW